MWHQYIGSLLHFGLLIAAAYVMAAMAWLYFDAYRVRRSWRELIRVIGLVLVAGSLVFSAIEPQGVGWQVTGFGSEIVPLVALVMRIVGYVLVLFSLVIEPLQPLPTYAAAGVLGGMGVVVDPGWFSLPILATLIGLLYWRRATVGLEAHIRRPAMGFWLLAAFELTQLGRMWYETVHPVIWAGVMPFGWIWWAGRVFLLGSVVVLGIWVFSYLLKQFTTQLFILFSAVALTSFLVVTIGFTGMLFTGLRDEAGRQVKTSLAVLAYAFSEQQDRLMSEAALTASIPGLVMAIEEGEFSEVGMAVTEAISGKRISQAVVVDAAGVVLWASDSQERAGEVWADGWLMVRLSRGERVRSFLTGGEEDPAVAVMAAVPLLSGETMVGGLVYTLTIDPLLLMGIQAATGLEAGVYDQTTLVASSLEVDEAVAGMKETRPAIVEPVLTRGEAVTGSFEWLSVPYVAVYEPVKDANNAVVGMLFGGRPETEVMATAARSLEVTFYLTAALMVLSLYPAWRISKSISGQVE